MSNIAKIRLLVINAFFFSCVNLGVFASRGISGTSSIVETTYGRVRGSTSISRDGNTYHQFLGIRYAAAPIGDLRFESPQPPESWTGVKETVSFRKPCIQFEVMFIRRVMGVEDCLYLNVFTPAKITTKSDGSNGLPVMVFIHGGGFMSGNPSMYKGKYLTDESVILVTMAYRVGSFGFLSTENRTVRGNMGLKDQTMALRWVQDNIKNFGGDPDRVTLFGESSGGASTHLHMFSKNSRGLFQRAISQSGTALRAYPLTTDYLGQTYHLAALVNCPTTDIEETVRCLKNTNALRIAEAHREATTSIPNKYALYGPIIENVDDEEAFLTENPRKLLKTGEYSRVPWISGANSADGILFAKSSLKDETRAKELDDPKLWSIYLPTLLRYDEDAYSNDTVNAAEKIRSFYFGSESPTAKRNFQNYTNMFSDRMHYLPMHNAALVQSQYSDVYLYYFDYKTMVSVLKLAEATQRESRVLPAELQIAGYFVHSWLGENLLGVERPFYGAAHADELFLLFNLNVILEARPGSKDYDASRSMVKLWADFAKGNDTASVDFDGKPWPGTNPKNIPLQYLKIERKRTVISEPFEDRINFWTSLNLNHLGTPISS